MSESTPVDSAINAGSEEKPKPKSKWSSRKRLKPITKKSISETSDKDKEKDFFSRANNVEMESDDEGDISDEKKSDKKKLKVAAVKPGATEAKQEINVNQDAVALELKSNKKVPNVKPEFGSDDIKSELPPASRLRSGVGTAIEDYDDIIEMPSAPAVDTLETIRKMKLALKERQNKSIFSVNVNLSCDISTFGPAKSVTIAINSTEPFSVLKEKYIHHCIQNKLPYFDNESIRVMVGTTDFVWNGTILSTAVTPLTLGIDKNDPTMDIKVMYRVDFERQQSVDNLLEEGEEGEEEFINDVEGEKAEASGDEEEQGEEYFRIKLKDKDNAQFEVRVNKSTQIMKLINFYRSKKELSDDIKIKLEFDDEPLDSNGIVGDTELEEDFVIDVYIS